MTTAALKKAACDAIDAAADDLNELSQQIWKNPELCFQEYKASTLLADFLEVRNFCVDRKYPVDTGFRATLPTGADEGAPVVVVLCEYDALPEIGHACGHNLIAEVGVGAALGVQAAIASVGEAGKRMGKLLVYGTPAEEGGGGKVDFIRSGAFTDPPVACALMAHPFHLDVAAGTTLCYRVVNVTFRGRASHAAGAPWDGINALDAAIMAYNSISVLRQQLPLNWRVHGIITNGGQKASIIPDKSEMEIVIRTGTPPELKRLRQKVEYCLQAAALATGCQVDIVWDDKPYESLISNATLASLYTLNAIDLGLSFLPSDPLPPLGSTDMGNVSHVVPSMHPMFRIGAASVHTRPFQVIAGSEEAQPPTLKQAKLLAMTAIDVFTQPDLVAKMAAELKHDLEAEERACGN